MSESRGGQVPDCDTVVAGAGHVRVVRRQCAFPHRARSGIENCRWLVAGHRPEATFLVLTGSDEPLTGAREGAVVDGSLMAPPPPPSRAPREIVELYEAVPAP